MTANMSEARKRPSRRGKSPVQEKDESKHSRREREGRGTSPRNGSKSPNSKSPTARRMLNKKSATAASTRSSDFLDSMIDKLSILGVVGILMGISAVAIGVQGLPGDWSRRLC